MLPFLTESFGNPSSAHALRPGAPGPALDEAHERVAARLARRAPRDRLHVRRDRGQQPRHQGRRVGRQGARPPDRDLVGRAPRRRPHAALPREVRVRDRRAAGRPLRPGRPGPASTRRSPTGRSSSRSCSPTTRSGRSSRSPRSRRRVARAQGRPVPRRRRPGGAVRRPRRRGARVRTSSRSGAHKFEGPKGVGALYVRHGTHILAQQQGGDPGAASPGRHRERRRRRRPGRGLRAVVRRAPRDGRAARDGCASGSQTAVLAVAGRELTGHPKERLPGLLSIIARDTDGASVALSLDLEGIAAFGRLGVHDRLDRGQPRPDRDGLSRRRRRAARCGCRSAGRRPTRRSTTAVDVVPRVIASMRVGAAAVAADPLGPGRRRHEPDPRRDVRRGRLVGRRGAAARAGPRGRRRLDAPARRRRHVLRVQEELLLARRGRRRPAGRRPARHPVLRHEPRARVRRRRAPAVPRRVPRRADAEPVRRLQHVREVRGAARPGAPPVRLRGGGDRPLRPAGRGRGRAGAAAPGPRRRTRTRPTSCTACARTSSSTPGSRSAS